MMPIATRGGFAASIRIFALLAISQAWDQPVSASLQASAPTDRDAAVVARFVPSSNLATTEFAQGFQRSRSGGQQSPRIYRDKITPHWFAGNSRFWYRNDLRGGGTEFILVDTERASRGAAFDHDKLAAALSEATGSNYRPDRLPFDSIEFVDDASAIRFKVGDARWSCDLKSYECAKLEADNSRRESADSGQRSAGQEPSRPGQERRGPNRSPISPDGKWTAIVQDHNVVVRAREDGKDTQLSHDGREGLAYGMLQWSPDSTTLVAFRIEPGERKEVHVLQSSPPGGGRAKLQTRPYDLPGDKLASFELNLFRMEPAAESDSKPAEKPQGDAAMKWKAIKPAVDRIDLGTPRLRWRPDGRSFSYTKTDRGHQRFRLIEVDAASGSAREIIDERTETYIWTAHTENVRLETVNSLERSGEIIYVSERDGWRHLYLIDAAPSPPTPLPARGASDNAEGLALPTPLPVGGERGRGEGLALPTPLPVDGERGRGEGLHQITKGEWIVRGIDRIDEENRQIWFRASGMNPEQDPYLVHFCRVNFDGSGLVALTAGNGNHSIQFSPDNKFIIDTYSRVDIAPVHELRRVADGSLVCELERADTSELTESGWEPPEVFVAKGRDDTTAIWGIICRPRDFDPNRKYPVIEDIYAGPQGSFVPKTFSPQRRNASLTDLGFVVAKIDGMGTANRSKAFHDVCWKNLKDAGLPDRILWHQAVAAKYPWYDTSRVGVNGNSAGGQNAAGAVLFHPDFYKVAVAACGCHDNRMDKASWNEQWMGYPVGPQYSESSNIDNAHRLRGKLFLIVGEMDTNVPPESTLRFADALIKAGKDFDLLVIPGGGHGMGGAYGQRRMHDFFVRHLLGAEPPDRNAGTGRRGE